MKFNMLVQFPMSQEEKEEFMINKNLIQILQITQLGDCVIQNKS